jgi:hypothetical protein
MRWGGVDPVDQGFDPHPPEHECEERDTDACQQRRKEAKAIGVAHGVSLDMVADPDLGSATETPTGPSRGAWLSPIGACEVRAPPYLARTAAVSVALRRTGAASRS